MRYDKLVSRTLEVADRVKRGQRIEDSAIELKREWTSAEKFARQLAAHANASGGNDITWIIGLDEVEGVIGVDDSEVGDHLGSVRKWFVGPSPALTLDATPNVDGKTLRALLFSTDRAPYVVKNPAFGIPLPSGSPNNPVTSEVPWREGATTRSATHEDLIRILSPLSAVPDLEVLDGELGEYEMAGRLRMRLNIYVDSERDVGIVIPFHRCDATITFSGIGPVPSSRVWMEPRTETLVRTIERMHPRPQSLSPTLFGTHDEVFISGPGRLTLHSQHDPDETAFKLIGKSDGEFRATLRASRAARPIVVSTHLRYREGSPKPLWVASTNKGES
jgi:hypothetical protein